LILVLNLMKGLMIASRMDMGSMLVIVVVWRGSIASLQVLIPLY